MVIKPFINKTYFESNHFDAHTQLSETKITKLIKFNETYFQLKHLFCILHNEKLVLSTGMFEMQYTEENFGLVKFGI